MIEIDGSMHSGSGTVLRYAVALASLSREPIHVIRVRAKRPKPGLRAQHVSAVNVVCSLSGGRLEGAAVGSQEIAYWPGNTFAGGDFHFDIGTAGSATLAAFTLIPRALFGLKPSTISITGGLFQDFAPSFFHMKEVLLPVLRSMGADLHLQMIRPGYVPQGGGRLKLQVSPVTAPLDAFTLLNRGSVRTIRGIALASISASNGWPRGWPSVAGIFSGQEVLLRKSKSWKMPPHLRREPRSPSGLLRMPDACWGPIGRASPAAGRNPLRNSL